MTGGRSVLHISPHPDDETLGCGGSLLRHVAAGDRVHWLIVTASSLSDDVQGALIPAVSRAYAFAGVHRLQLRESRLETLPLAEIIDRIAAAVRDVEPSIVYVPHPGDAHTDHRVVFDASIPCTKWFRFPSVRRVLVYETPSETGFGLDPDRHAFRPNVYCDVTPQLERKLEILRLYGPAEIGTHPFPRSEDAVRALATLRGAESGYAAAEAFMLLRERA